MFELKFSTSGSAFEEISEQEIARILETTAEKIKNGYTDGPVMDINGNRIGEWGFDIGEE